MKKVLLSITAGLLSVTMASAQCTPLTAYADSSFGLWPDSAAFINSGAVHGADYCKQIDIKTFVDTTYLTADIKIDAFKIVSVTGLPTGFSWSGGGTNWNGTDTWYNSGATASGTADPALLAPIQGCLNLSATAAAVDAIAPGDYDLIVSVDVRIGSPSIFAGNWGSTIAPSSFPFQVTSYILRVNADSTSIIIPELDNDCNQEVGIEETLSASRFDVGQNYPNPATGETVFTFNTPTSSTVEFSIYNMLGVVVATEVINSEAGLNTFKFNTNDLSSGMYVYSLRSNGSTITKRMTVK